MIARQATGALRDAISLLDQLVSSESKVTLARAQELLGTAAGQAVQGLVEAIAALDAAAGLEVISTTIDAGTDPRQLARQMVDYLRGLMLIRTGNAGLVEATTEMRASMAQQAQRLELAALLRAIRVFNAAANDVRGGWQPQLPLELALVECASAPVEAAPVSVMPAAPVAPSPVASAKPASVAPAGRSAPAPKPDAPSAPVKASASPASIPSDLKTVWSRLLAVTRERDKGLEAFLRSCTPSKLEGQMLHLSTNVELAHKKITDQSQLIDQLLSEVLGGRGKVQCQLTGRASPKKSAKDVPADGMVSTALDLGGEIVE
jgi:DNA polymerase-3 subunit gamma/tau